MSPVTSRCDLQTPGAPRRDEQGRSGAQCGCGPVPTCVPGCRGVKCPGTHEDETVPGDEEVDSSSRVRDLSLRR